MSKLDLPNEHALDDEGDLVLETIYKDPLWPTFASVAAKYVATLMEKTKATRIEISLCDYPENVKASADYGGDWEILAFDQDYLQYKRSGATLGEAADRITKAMEKL